jgi:hypothetical protein
VSTLAQAARRSKFDTVNSGKSGAIMRDTFEWIDGAANGNEDLRHALYDLAAQQIAAQALSVAFATLAEINENEARRVVEQVAGYPGVTMRKMRADSETTVGKRATEILMRLARMRSGFVRS